MAKSMVSLDGFVNNQHGSGTLHVQREDEVKKKAEEETKKAEETKKKAEEAKKKAEKEAKKKAKAEAKKAEKERKKAERERKKARREEKKKKQAQVVKAKSKAPSAAPSIPTARSTIAAEGAHLDLPLVRIIHSMLRNALTDMISRHHLSVRSATLHSRIGFGFRQLVIDTSSSFYYTEPHLPSQHVTRYHTTVLNNVTTVSGSAIGSPDSEVVPRLEDSEGHVASVPLQAEHPLKTSVLQEPDHNEDSVPTAGTTTEGTTFL